MSVWDQYIGHIVSNKTDSLGDIEHVWLSAVGSLRIEVRTEGSTLRWWTLREVWNVMCFVDLSEATHPPI